MLTEAVTRRKCMVNILKLAGVGLAAACGGRSSIGAISDGSVVNRTDGISVPDAYRPDILDQCAPLILKQRVISLLQSDSRLELLQGNFNKYTSVEDFTADIEKRYGNQGACKFVDTMEKTVTYLHQVESKLGKDYGVKVFARTIELVVSTDVKFYGGSAGADRIRLWLCHPDAHSKTPGLKPIIAHEYGHFLHSHDLDGNLLFPNPSTSFQIDMDQMKKDGVVRRYHLDHIYFKPFMSSELKESEHVYFAEQIANRVMQLLMSDPLDSKNAKDMVQEYLEAGYTQIAKDPKQQKDLEGILIISMSLAESFGLTDLKTKFESLLFANSAMNPADLQKYLNIANSFFNKIQLVKY